MKKLIIFLAANLFAMSVAFSQGAAINSTGASADNSAGLDINFSNKGLLMPRVSLTGTTDQTTIINPALSLLVYNTAPAGTSPNNVVPGFYYWDGTKWVQNGGTGTPGTNPGDMLYWNGTSWVVVPAGQPGQFLQFTVSNIPAWTGNAYPTLTTTTASSIGGTYAISGGDVTSDGGVGYLIERGICWSTSANPTISDNIIADCSWCGIGTFTSSITGLTILTTYYVRAYAINSIGTAYGNEVSFTTTSPSVPIVTTTSASSSTGNTATSGGNVTSDGGSVVTARGVCWSTSVNPTTANSITTDGIGTGTFTSSITGLTLGDTYYVRAYATNSFGTSYGNETSFTALAIGDNYQGGIVAYILQPGDPGYDANVLHGLIAAPSDQTCSWGCYGTAITGADGTAIGTGAQNTLDIINGCPITGIAAELCYNLDLGGYSDWYLPSIDELTKLYINRNTIGGFSWMEYYWSSTEANDTNDWSCRFYNGLATYYRKNDTGNVRAVRAF